MFGQKSTWKKKQSNLEYVDKKDRLILYLLLDGMLGINIRYILKVGHVNLQLGSIRVIVQHDFHKNQ
jgi:hypothetical protein